MTDHKALPEVREPKLHHECIAVAKLGLQTAEILKPGLTGLRTWGWRKDMPAQFPNVCGVHLAAPRK